MRIIDNVFPHSDTSLNSITIPPLLEVGKLALGIIPLIVCRSGGEEEM
jgi:hypothetical protein